MFRAKSLDRILSSFTVIMTDLHELTENHSNHIAEKKEEISALTTEINNHDAEKTQALLVLGNLEKLLTKGN